MSKLSLSYANRFNTPKDDFWGRAAAEMGFIYRTTERERELRKENARLREEVAALRQVEALGDIELPDLP